MSQAQAMTKHNKGKAGGGLTFCKSQIDLCLRHRYISQSRFAYNQVTYIRVVFKSNGMS